MDERNLALEENLRRGVRFDTVIVTIFGGRFTFCIPKEDWELLLEVSFEGQVPPMPDLSEEVRKRTGIVGDDVSKWNGIAKLLHRSIDEERTDKDELEEPFSLLSFVEEVEEDEEFEKG